MKKLLKVLVLLLVLVSCDRSHNEPRIDGGEKHYRFDYRAQRKDFRVVVSGGRKYNRKVDWHIVAIVDLKDGSVLSNQVDTLPDGSMSISYDWVTFKVPRGKSKVIVDVQENNTGKFRSIHFSTTNSGKEIFTPDIGISQSPRVSTP